MAELPKAGKIKKTTENKLFGYKMLTLSNGAKVVLKKTDFKNDEVQFAATANGGTSAFGTKDLNEVKMMGALMNSSGLRRYWLVRLLLADSVFQDTVMVWVVAQLQRIWRL